MPIPIATIIAIVIISSNINSPIILVYTKLLAI